MAHCLTNTTQQYNQQRRTANYQPTSWSHDFIESIANQKYHMNEVEEENFEKMEEVIRGMLEDKGDVEPLMLLELVDDIHRLGMGYRFEESIKRALEKIMLPQSSRKLDMINLYVCALYFRLLRQHGYHISAGLYKDIFESFKDINGNFNASVTADIRGILSLYEASYYGFGGENILDEARKFTIFHLKNNIIGDVDSKIAKRVSHALEFPCHHRMSRLEARWNIEMYDDEQNATNQLLHKLAILDFNMVQSVHQSELQEVSRWWRHVGLENKLSFARNRIMECFFAAVGIIFEPQFGKCRIGLTKVLILIYVLDDIYDVYGYLEELEQFKDVDKWDVNVVDQLPDYMKLYFLALHNTLNDLVPHTPKEQHQFIVYQLREGWADLCKAFLREAKWSYNNCKPKFTEYLDNGWISSSGVVILSHAYYLMNQTITKEAKMSLINCHGLLRFPSMIFRLANDLCSNEEVGKAVSCYMHETGSSYEVACAFVKELIDENWKMMNKEIIYNTIFDKSFVEMCFNLARIAMCQYQYGVDVHTEPNDASRNRVTSIIINPVNVLKVELLEVHS